MHERSDDEQYVTPFALKLAWGGILIILVLGMLYR